MLFFFTYYFHTAEGQKRLLANKSYVGVPALAQATTNFKLIEFPLIELSSQRKIAKVLSSLDAKIDLNNRINAELEAMAKLLYDYWFVQFDFPISAAYATSVGRPELAGKPYKSSGGEMVYNKRLRREIPEGWGDAFLGDLGEFKNGINYDPSEEGDTMARIINVRNISSSSIFISNEDLDEIWLKGSNVKNI
ncbi:MAG: restriction endonuclease subunit S [Saprospirales bacterium]|nr:restriction endonuclease subunit S [Saprospirales bacterium]